MANLRFILLFLVLLGCSTANAATRCPLPGGTCLPAHGHPVLETKINQLRDEFQRHADRSDAQVQKLQAEVAQQGERLSGLSARIDALSIEVARLKESAAKKDNRWLDLLLSGVVASIVSALFIWLNRRSDLTTALVNQYQDLMNDRAGLAALFAPSLWRQPLRLAGQSEPVGEGWELVRSARRGLSSLASKPWDALGPRAGGGSAEIQEQRREQCKPRKHPEPAGRRVAAPGATERLTATQLAQVVVTLTEPIGPWEENHAC